MPSIGFSKPPVELSLTVSETIFEEGPYPGFIDKHFVWDFGIFFIDEPNVFTTTGNPHWTAHPIWIGLGNAGFVVNRKTPSPGGRTFKVHLLAVGILNKNLKEKVSKRKSGIINVSKKEFERLARKYQAPRS